MTRKPRIDVGQEIYHVLNRSVAKQHIFKTPEDYKLFEDVLTETVEITETKLLAYCVMSNHWHIVLQTRNDGDLSTFMKRLSAVHTQRYRSITKTIGQGPVYQGRYKSFIVDQDNHLLSLLSYVERNPLAANLVKNPLDYRYSSLYRRYKGTSKEKEILANWPMEEPEDYLSIIKKPLSNTETEKLERSLQKEVPFGDEAYVLHNAKKFKISNILRGKGRPRHV